MKKIFIKLHRWIAIPLGILIAIICLTGAILVFRTEIEELSNPKLYFVEKTNSEPLSIAEIMPAVSEQLEEENISGITIPADKKRSYTITTSENPRAPIYINQYTGEVIGRKNNPNFFGKMLQLHRWLLIKRDIGKPIVGYSTLIFVFILITGIIIAFPKNRKQAKNVYRIRVNKGFKKFFYDLHVSGGFYTKLGLLVLALTGLTWSFPWYRTAFYGAFGVKLEQNPGGLGSNNQPQNNQQTNQQSQSRGENRDRGERGERKNRTNYAVWDDILEEIERENPNYKTISIRNNSATVSQNKTFGNSRASDRYEFDEITAEIIKYTPYKELEKISKIRGWVYSIHVGSWGGVFSKIITFIIALVGGFLPITGYYLWIKRLRRKAAKKKKAI